MFSKRQTNRATNGFSDSRPDGYRETIQKGVTAVRHIDTKISYGVGTPKEQLARLKTELQTADAIVIGAGAGLSTAAGMTYSGERFEKYFSDFARKFGFRDMYSGGFYPYPTPEEQWAFWSRNIYINRYMDPPKPVYRDLLELVQDKDYFVITTNVDHCFQKAGFDKQRLFYTQGDYGLWQCEEPCHTRTYDNEETVRQMVLAQGFEIAEDGTLYLPKGVTPNMAVPAGLVPRCPRCGRPMTMNLRVDDTFVEDRLWQAASERYSEFLRRYKGMHILFLELGVGANTPVIVKYPFWQMTATNEKAVYACLNFGEAYAIKQIEERSICLDGDIAEILTEL